MRVSSKTRFVFAVAGSLVVGVLLGSTVFSNLLHHNTSSANGALTIRGTETIQVFGADGKLISTWQGPDPLTQSARNAIAGCIPGTNGGSVQGGCDTFIKYVHVWLDNGVSTCTENLGMFEGALPPCIFSSSQAPNSPTPPGCDLITKGDCTGWQTVATFLPGFQGNIKANVEAVGATSSSVRFGGTGGYFDILCATAFGDPACTTQLTPSPIATVSPGQTLVVTIAFTIS